jgi:hypothetical protein
VRRHSYEGSPKLGPTAPKDGAACGREAGTELVARGADRAQVGTHRRFSAIASHGYPPFYGISRLEMPRPGAQASLRRGAKT